MKKHSTIAAIAVVMTVGCASSLPPEARRAQGLLQRGAYEEAERAAEQGLVQHPELAALWRVKIQAALGRGDAERAVSVYARWYRKRGGHDGAVVKRMALTTLWQGVRVPSALVRAQTIQAIERLEVEALARDVAARIDDPEDLVAAAAAVALLRSQPGAPRVAGQLLHSEDPRARAIAVEGIGRKVGGAARADLLPALADQRAMVRSAAVEAIAPMDAPGDTARWLEMAARDPDAGVRAAALRALATSAQDVAPARQVAIAALADESLQVRVAAVELVAATGDRATLVQVMGAGDTLAGLRAAVALDRRDAAATALVEGALADPSPEVRAAALDALTALVPESAALARATAKLDDPSGVVRVAAARVLVALGDERGAEALSALCAADDAATREAAVRAHGPRDLLTLGLVSALADASAPIRVTAAEMLLGAVP